MKFRFQKRRGSMRTQSGSLQACKSIQVLTMEYPDNRIQGTNFGVETVCQFVVEKIAD